jgi:hypothetical protein
MALFGAGSANTGAQTRKLRVVSTDGQPIVYANVSVEGAPPQITDERGAVTLGSGKRQTFTVRVTRIGYSPWFGKVDLPDTTEAFTVTLPRLAQSLEAVTVTGERAIKSPLELTGFYDRWMMRQKGTLSAVFIGPEEIEFRHPDRITNMLNGLNGVQMRRECDRGNCGQVAFRLGCGPMAIVIDGQQQYPPKAGYVDIDMLLMASDVAAIEVYVRGGNMPVNFQFQDTVCGVIAFWTGAENRSVSTRSRFCVTALILASALASAAPRAARKQSVRCASSMRKLKPLSGGLNAMLPEGARRGRATIIVDEWGPYDYRAPKLWPKASPSGRPLTLRVLGPAGRWTSWCPCTASR